MYFFQSEKVHNFFFQCNKGNVRVPKKVLEDHLDMHILKASKSNEQEEKKSKRGKQGI